MPAAPLILGAVGAGTSAIGAIEGGQAKSAQASYQAQVAANNAIIEQQNAQYAIEAGSQQTTNAGLRSAATGGKLRAGQAANGIDVNSGSAVDVQKGQREAGALDQQTTMNDALLKAYGYNTQSTGFTAEQGLDEAKASEAPIAGALGAAGSLLSNASSIGFKWGQSQSPTPGG